MNVYVCIYGYIYIHTYYTDYTYIYMHIYIYLHSNPKEGILDTYSGPPRARYHQSVRTLSEQQQVGANCGYLGGRGT